MNRGSSISIGNTGTSYSTITPHTLISAPFATSDIIVDSGTFVINHNFEDDNAYIGLTEGSNGTIVTLGQDTVWTNNEGVFVGVEGAGTLTLLDKSTTIVDGGNGTVNVAEYAGSTGIVNIGNPVGDNPVVAGFLDAENLVMGAGDALLNFNHISELYYLYTNILGSGDITHHAGRTFFSGDSSITGDVDVYGGRMILVEELVNDTSTISLEHFKHASVEATGEDANWNTRFDLTVGDKGTGELKVSDRATVSADNIYISNSRNSAGHVDVYGRRSELNSRFDLIVGKRGEGSLAVYEDGTVTVKNGTGTLQVGGRTNGVGTVYIGSSTDLFPRRAGHINAAEVELASVNSSLVFNHLNHSYDFDPEITGQGSVMHLNGTTNILGGINTTGSLYMTGNGGTINAESDISIDYFAMEAGVFNATTEDTKIEVASSVHIAQFANGTFTLGNGAELEVDGGAGTINVAEFEGSTGTVNIGSAVGDSPAAAGYLDAENLVMGSGDALLNFNHTSELAYIYTNILGSGDIAHHSGRTFFSGDSSITGDVDVYGGRMILVEELVNDTSTISLERFKHAYVEATGKDANWNTRFDLTVGEKGRGTLIVSDGATVSADNIYISNSRHSAGHVDVYGRNSELNSRFDFAVGKRGEGTLAIYEGGEVTVENGTGTLQVGGRTNGVGTVYIGSSIDLVPRRAGHINAEKVKLASVDSSINFNHLNRSYDFDPEITGQGSVTHINGTTNILGSINTTGSLYMTGNGGTINAESDISIGYFGMDAGVFNATTENTNINVDGPVEIAQVWEGSFILGNGATLTVEDGDGTIYSGSGMDSEGAIFIGSNDYDVPFAPGEINAKNIVFSQNGYQALYFNHTSDNYSFDLDITGYGDIFTTFGYTTLSGSIDITGDLLAEGFSTLTITGDVSSDDGIIDNEGNALISGGSWKTTGFFVVGDEGNGFLTIEDRARVNSVTSIIGNYGMAPVRVTDAGTHWESSDSLTVGQYGLGELTISNKATVSVGDGEGTLYLAKMEGSTGLLNLGSFEGATAVAPGDLNVARVVFGDGSGQILLNHNRRNYELGFAIEGTGQVLVQNGKTKQGNIWDETVTTYIEGGELDIRGEAEGQFYVLNEGRLSGTGTIGEATVFDGGVLSPGRVFGSLGVSGDLTLGAGSIYEININSAGRKSLVDAGGEIDIGTYSNLAISAIGSDYGWEENYTILEGESISGEFGDIYINQDSLYPVVAYGDTRTDLSIYNFDIPVTYVARTSNEYQAAEAVDELGTDDPVYIAIHTLPESEARDALNDVSGEIYASLTSVMLQDSRFVRLAAQSNAREGEATSWARGYGSWGEWDGNGNAAKISRNTGGFFVGVDGSVSEDLSIGLLAGYGYASYDVDARRSNADNNMLHLGSYGKYSYNNLRLGLGTAYTANFLDVDRTVDVNTIYEKDSGSYIANTIQVYGDVFYLFETPYAVFIPFVSGAFVAQSANSFTEGGGGNTSQVVNPDTQTAFFTTLGARIQREFEISDHALSIFAEAGWQHTAGQDTSKTRNSYRHDTSAEQIIEGVPLARDVVWISAGFEGEIRENWSLGVAYDGRFGDGTTDNGVQAELRVRF
ncbi:autotransporter domain-containing protein [Flexibacterium corallicola]|uniref:autotransporter domain-containing protein n=1 Tax=Flexibacterium corallicola TaxID=3037259 RepID=UPI00286EE82E|nr:autotransporter domain-containing protein [Pseudovibrio sp. M1P-2-3]